jgi:amidohydrolase
VVTIGSIHGGNRFNIIPDEVEMVGTIRTLDEGMRDDIHKRIKQTAEMIAQSGGATAEVEIEKPYAVTVNSEALAAQMLPTVKRVAGENNVAPGPKLTGAEDFSFFAQKVPGVFYFIGITPPGSDLSNVAYNHSPKFFVDESGLQLGVRLLANLTVDFMNSKQ